MEPLYGILIVAFVALVGYIVAAVALVRRTKQSQTWDQLKGLTWFAFAAAVVILLSVFAALVVTLVGMADGGAIALILFGVVAVVLVGAFYMFLVHPLVRVLRNQGQGPASPSA